MMQLPEDYRALSGSAGSWIARGFGHFEIAGADANAFANRLVTADLSLLTAGHFVPSLLLRDDASILDRVMVYRFPERVMLLAGPTQRAAVWEHVVARKRGVVRLRDISDDMGYLALRGPAAIARVTPLMTPIPQLPGEVASARLAGIDVFAARALDDGPDGLDLHCRMRDLASLEHALINAGVVPVSDDSWHITEVEWGVAAVGRDIDPDDTPMEASLDALVAEGKGAPFPGETALASRRRTGAIKRLVGFHLTGDAIPPAAARVSVAGVMVDRVRDVVRSPRVGVIGTTAIPTSADTPGTALTLISGDATWQATVVRRPFVSRSLT